MTPAQRQRFLDMQFLQTMGQGGLGFNNPFGSTSNEISIRDAMSMRKPIESYTYEDMRGMGMSDDQIAQYFGKQRIIPSMGVQLGDQSAAFYGDE